MNKWLKVLGLATITLIMFQIFYWGKVLPGISMAGINLSNKNQKQVEIALKTLGEKSVIQLYWETSNWEIKIQDIGLEYNIRESAEKALKTKKIGKQEIKPIFSLDENRLTVAIASISSQINIPAKDPQVTVEQGLIKVSDGENGQEVDERELKSRILENIQAGLVKKVEIPVRKLSPKLSEEQNLKLKSRAEKLLNKEIKVVFENQTWNITPEQTVAWLEIGGWKRPEIEIWGGQLAGNIDRPAQNAHFRYLGSQKVEEFAPGQDGLVVKQLELTNLLLNSLTNLEQGTNNLEITVPVNRTLPDINTSQVNNLGIKELLAQGESNFAGSIPNRIFNIEKAASNMNGILVAPGETFSFDKYVGDISVTGGYRQAYVIKEGKTVLGDGGGVCQVSTTLFRAALNAGLPIIERTAHAYRVHYYEQDSQPGFDATIFTPNVDLKFKNDTSSYILVQTTVDEIHTKLYFDLYGTKDGRQVSLSKPRIWDIVPPPPSLYQDDPTLAKGTVKQVDWSAWGTKTSFDYKVTRGDEVLQDRTFYSVYQPWQAVYLRGVL